MKKKKEKEGGWGQGEGPTEHIGYVFYGQEGGRGRPFVCEDY